MSETPEPRRNSKKNRSPVRLGTLVKEYSSSAVVLVFALYCIGFVIVNTHLGKFGVRPGVLNSFDYIAASLCYLLFVAVVGFPAWVLLYGMTNKPINKTGISSWIFAVIIVWYFLLGQFTRLFFGDLTEKRDVGISGRVILIVAILHITLVVVLKYSGRLLRLRRALADWKYFYVYVAMDGFIGFIRRPDVDHTFVFGAIVLYGVVSSLPEFQDWKLQDYLKYNEICAMIGIFAVCLVFASASEFGKLQYGFLPTSIGGGKLSRVFLKTPLATAENADLLALPVSKGLIGPVMLIYQSDKQVFVVAEKPIDGKPHNAIQIRADLVEVIRNDVMKETSPKSPENGKQPSSTEKPLPSLEQAEQWTD